MEEMNSYITTHVHAHYFHLNFIISLLFSVGGYLNLFSVEVSNGH